MKKGQMEMVGLAVIVIILIIAFVLFLTLNRGQDTSSITSRESLYANNLLNAIMLYSYYDESIFESLIKCDDYSNQVGRNDDVRKYCDDIKNEIETRIMPLVLKNNQDYGINFDGECGRIENINEGICGDEYITASPYYIRTKTGTCEVRLKLC